MRKGYFFIKNFQLSSSLFFRIKSTKSNVDDGFYLCTNFVHSSDFVQSPLLKSITKWQSIFPPPSVISSQDSIAWKGFFSNLPAILLRRCVPMSISFPMGSSFYCRKFSFKFISADIFRISIPFPSYFRYQAVRPAYGNGRPPHMGTTGLPAGN